MTLTRLILREISHRKLNFFLSVLGVTLAAAAVLGVISLVRVHDAETEDILGTMAAETEARMATLTDDIRKSMKGLGFNIHIFPENQDLAEVYSEGYASEVMPESYVDTLAKSPIVTVNHLLPSLTKKLEWPEQKRTVVLIGIRGEVPIAFADPKKPILDPVPPGELVLGFELHRSIGLAVGDPVPFMGRTFKVSKCHPARGTVDDITIWMNLAECQDLLGLQGKINSIQALECNCETVDRLGEVRAELLAILPGTKIIETGSKALARAEARTQTELAAKEEIAKVALLRSDQRSQRQRFAATLAPAITLFSMSWVALLALGNVRERTTEIGILRALGTGTPKILATFLGRAALVGLTGALAAIALFWLTSIAFPHFFGNLPFSHLAPLPELAVLAASAPILAALAAWLPALNASLRDPASVLRHD